MIAEDGTIMLVEPYAGTAPRPAHVAARDFTPLTR